MLRDVFLVSIDCLRPDHLGLYNALSRLSPNLDRLAAGATVFTEAVTHAPFTTPALASLLTGRYPFRTGVRLLLGQLCDPNVPTLAEFARRAGYATAGFPSTFILNAPTGLDRGFDEYRDITDGLDTGRGGAWQTGDRLNDALDGFLARAGRQRVFCWLHYFDLHDFHLDKTVPPETSYPRDLRDRIDRDCIGGLLDVLARRGRLDTAAFIITADHAEDLYQHGHRGHGHHLYDSVLRVPLVCNFRMPVKTTQVVRDQVRHVDLLPTLLDLWGLPRDDRPAGLDGRSLLGLIRGEPAPPGEPPSPAAASYAETSPRQLFEGDLRSLRTFAGPEQRALRTRRSKFILHADGRRELYDLAADPREMNDLADGRPDLAEPLARALADLAAGDADRFAPAPVTPGDEQKVMARLRELGYVA